MTTVSPGIHHVTAISGSARENYSFYTGLLGLRLVKRTVNFDDPTTYHLYYGDESGSPGSILTFFPWADVSRGRTGRGMAGATAFAVSQLSLDYWVERLADLGADFSSPRERFGEPIIALPDPHGLQLELVFTSRASNAKSWSHGDIDRAHALGAFDGLTLHVSNSDGVSHLLQTVLGFEVAFQNESRIRLQSDAAGSGQYVDLESTPASQPGRSGSGTVHHVAFRARTDSEQHEISENLLRMGVQPTETIDRQYFRSIYFRHPVWTGGVLFEVATDQPGFLVDEAAEQLGTHLMLPPHYESRRDSIEQQLPGLV